MKSIALFLIFMFSTVVISAQETCSFKSKTVQLLLNLQLGDSPEQTRNVLGNNLKIKIGKNGEQTFFQNFIKKPAPQSLNGVRALYLRFFDRRLYQIEIFYEPRTDLQTLEEIKNVLSSQLNLPVADWQRSYDQTEIKCGEFSLVADNILNPRIELTDETIFATVENSREKAKKK